MGLGKEVDGAHWPKCSGKDNTNSNTREEKGWWTGFGKGIGDIHWLNGPVRTARGSMLAREKGWWMG